MDLTNGNPRLTEGSSLFLDLLRGLSAQAVLVGHALYFNGYHGAASPTGGYVMQNHAVLIFFLLSGFLIPYSTAHKLSGTRPYGFRDYFIDRFARIYAGFLPALLFVVVVDTCLRAAWPAEYIYEIGYGIRAFLGNLLLLQDIPGANYLLGGRVTSFGSAQVFWTLAVEWWIYVFFGWTFLRLLPRRGNAWLNLLIYFPLLVVPALHLWGGPGNGLMMTWLLGSLMWIVWRSGLLRSLNGAHSLLLGASFAATGLVRYLKVGAEYDPIMAFCTAGVLLLGIHFCGTTKFPARSARAVRFLAAFSYTLYLTHYTVLEVLRTAFAEVISPPLLLLTGLVVSNVIAIAIALYTEVTLTAQLKSALRSRFASTTQVG